MAEIIPVIIIALLGYFFKRIGIFKNEHGDLFLKIVFYISLPALILLSITRIELDIQFIFLPLISALVILITLIISFTTSRFLKLEKQTLGVFLTGTLILNIGFVLPFVIAAYGDEGLARLALFDLSNAILVFTLVYYIASKHGSNSHGRKTLIMKFILTPPIWALFISLLMNLMQWELPGIVIRLFDQLGQLTIPLMLLSLGIFFNPKIVKAIPLSMVIFIRMGIGFVLGYFFAEIFNLEGLERTIVIIGSAAPVGYNNLTFASLENLDKEFAASLVSIAMLIGIIMVPLLILFL
ncbi:AEC family transporter [Bacteroidota bacterium]